MYIYSSFPLYPSIQLILPFWQKTVNRFRRNTAEDRGRDTPSDTPKTPSLISTDGPAAAYEKGEGRHAIRLIQYEHLVEMVGKIGIPLIFALSNIVYWSYYLSWIGGLRNCLEIVVRIVEWNGDIKIEKIRKTPRISPLLKNQKQRENVSTVTEQKYDDFFDS